MIRLNPFNLPPVNSFESLPPDIIHMIFNYMKDPRLSAVCKIWEKINSSIEVYHLILSDYRSEKSMNYYLDHLPERMVSIEIIDTVKNLFHLINEKIYRYDLRVEAKKIQQDCKSGPLELYPVTRFIEDTALIDSCRCGGFEKCEELHLFVNGLDKKLSVAEKADSIREWMKANPIPLASMTKISMSNEIKHYYRKKFCEVAKLELIVAEISLFPNLRKINIFSKELFISSEISKLTNLQSINIWADSSYFPKSIKLLTSVQKLKLGSGQLTHPELIGEFINLKKLKFDSVQSLTILPDSISKLVKLEELILVDTRELKSLPESIGLLTNLTTINISQYFEYNVDYPPIGWKTLPEAIGKLINLTELTIQHSIDVIPESIGNLTNLEYLCLNSKKRWDFRIDKLFVCADIANAAYKKATTMKNSKINPYIFKNLEDKHKLMSGYLKAWKDNVFDFKTRDEDTASFITEFNLFLISITQLIDPTDSECEFKRFLAIQEDFEKFVNDLSTSSPGDGKISLLPDSFANLKNLSYLDLCNNNLSRLPISMKGLLSTIHTIEITGNPLETLSRDEWFDMSPEEDFDDDIQDDIM